jgi:hypothetical protein
MIDGTRALPRLVPIVSGLAVLLAGGGAVSAPVTARASERSCGPAADGLVYALRADIRARPSSHRSHSRRARRRARGAACRVARGVAQAWFDHQDRCGVSLSGAPRQRRCRVARFHCAARRLYGMVAKVRCARRRVGRLRFRFSP